MKLLAEAVGMQFLKGKSFGCFGNRKKTHYICQIKHFRLSCRKCLKTKAIEKLIKISREELTTVLVTENRSAMRAEFLWLHLWNWKY